MIHLTAVIAFELAEARRVLHEVGAQTTVGAPRRVAARGLARLEVEERRWRRWRPRRARRGQRHGRVRLPGVGVRERAQRLQGAQPGERLAVGAVGRVAARRRRVLVSKLVDVGVKVRARPAWCVGRGRVRERTVATWMRALTVLAVAVLGVGAAVVADDVAVGQLGARAALRVLRTGSVTRAG